MASEIQFLYPSTGSQLIHLKCGFPYVSQICNGNKRSTLCKDSFAATKQDSPRCCFALQMDECKFS
jgi:hypothetical protein